MKREFDFEEFGNKMSYKVPEGYFEQLTSRTVANAINHQKHHKIVMQRLGTSIAVAAVICMALILFTPQQKTSVRSSYRELSKADIEAIEEINSVLQEMSNKEIEQIVLLAENDYFLNDTF